jgi:hypothetical protein
MTEPSGKGFSAAGARKIDRRVQKVRLIDPPLQFTVKDEKGKEHKGTFKVIAALCPKVKTTTLKRRLDSGERDLLRLRRPPERKQRARSKKARQ